MIDFNNRSFRNLRHISLWFGLAFQAGAINAGGFMACHSYVSHVTGVGTAIGLEAAHGNIKVALELFMIPIAFFLGAAYSALLIDRPRAQGKRPRYTVAMGTMWGMLLTVFVAALLGAFGPFGEPFVLARDVLLVGLLCFVCGLQNAAIVSATSGAIRTTHLTGILTDLGINVVKVRYLPLLSKERFREILINRIRLGTFVSFSVGSGLGTFIFLQFGYGGFLLPVLTSFAFFAISLAANKSKEGILVAGPYHWRRNKILRPEVETASNAIPQTAKSRVE